MIDQRGVQIGPIGTLRFGQDVAEHDERLDSYFLRTGTYWALVHDEVDLVIGAKGTGKSAIARYLSRADADIEQLNDVIIMPAFNIRGSILFKRLINQVDADDEGIYRDIFLAYMVGLAGNYLIKTFQETTDVVALEEGIRSCGLIVDEPSPHSVWRRVLSRIRPRLGTTITIVDVNEPSDASVAQAAASPLLVSLDTLEGLLDLIHEALEQLDLRLWILFDRLDEAFPDRRDIEVAALRGLLRAHLDVCSFGTRLRPKLFLRLDIFDRITQKEGFVNATHLRTTRIAWDSDAILHMIALRVTASSDRRELVGPTIKDILTTSAGRRRLCRSIFPKRMENLDPLVWLLLVTVDATREFNPRNVLTLLRSAQLAEIQIAMRDRTGLSGRKDTFVLSSRALHQGYKQLSTARMQDTLYAESTIARTYIEKLRGRAVRFTESEISERLGVRGEELEEVLRVLRYIGFLRNNEGVFIVPPLYRPAFFMSIHGAELRLGAAEASEISDFAEQEDVVAVDSASAAPLSGEQTGGSLEAADGDEEQEGHAETPRAASAVKRKRRRTRPKRRESSRDELVPTNTPSEINDQLDFAQELGDALGNDDGELVEVTTEVGPALHGTSFVSPGVEASSVSSRDSTATLPARTGAWAVGQARELGDQGDAIGGFHLLYPQHTGHDGGACVAADLAYLSRDRATINLAIAMLKDGEVARSWPALARLLVFELMVGDLDAVSSLVSSASKRYAQEIAIAVVRMVGQVPELEAAFWQTSLAVLSSANAPNSMLKSIWPILAASRVMAIGRNSWERGAGNVASDLSALRNQIWTSELWNSTVRNIQGFLHAYAAGGPTATLPVLVPYQILSLASVLESAGRLSAALRAGVARSLGAHLDGTDVRHRERFLEWVQYSPLVLEVEMTSKVGVQAGPAERRSGARDARPQPDGTAARDQSRRADVLDRELCDFVVRVIQDGLFEGRPRMLLSQLGTRLLARSPGFNYRALGFTSLLDFVKAVSEADNRIVIEKTNHNHPYVVLS
ncbi:P-loop ATPase, Sll1717 family [Micromonospora sp. NPDC005163]